MKRDDLKKIDSSRELLKSIEVKTGADDEIISFKFRCCVGRDEEYRQIWRTMTISIDDVRIADKTPAKMLKELHTIKAEWDKEQKADYQRSGSKKDKNKISFCDFVRERWWVDHILDGTHTPTSIEFYRHMSNGLVSYFGKKKLSTIDGEAVKRYVKYLNTTATGKNGKPLAPSTVTHYFATLRNILGYAKRFGYIDQDPCQVLSQRERPHRKKKPVTFLEPKQAQRFLQCASDEPLYWECLLNVLILTGLRRGECVALQWGDINKEKLTLSVSRNITVDRSNPQKYHVGATKTGENRVIDITTSLLELLMALKREQENKYHASLMPSAFVFCSEADPYRAIYPTTVTRYVNKFIKKNRLPDVSPHDLRHTAATIALESGKSLKEVQDLLGHKDASTTLQYYAGLSEQAKRSTVEAIEALLRPKTAEK